MIIPPSVTRIGQRAFSGTAIEYVNIPDSVSEIGAYAFNATKIKEVILPPKLLVIENGVFSNCEHLERVILPDGVTEIKEYAFWMCTSLKKVELPYGLKVIGMYAFARCDNLSVVVPESVISVDKEAFVYVKNNENYADEFFYCKQVVDNSLPARRRRKGVCQYCGGSFSFWSGNCKDCGHQRDY